MLYGIVPFINQTQTEIYALTMRQVFPKTSLACTSALNSSSTLKTIQIITQSEIECNLWITTVLLGSLFVATEIRICMVRV